MKRILTNCARSFTQIERSCGSTSIVRPYPIDTTVLASTRPIVGAAVAHETPRFSSSLSTGVQPSNHVADLIDSLASVNVTPVSLSHFVTYGKLKTEEEMKRITMGFLRNEIPIRLAHMIKEFADLPPVYRVLPTVQHVEELYIESFKSLTELPPRNILATMSYADFLTEFDRFSHEIREIQERHQFVVTHMAYALFNLMKQEEIEDTTHYTIQYFLDRFYLSRIGIRTQISQFLELFRSPLASQARRDRIGMVDKECELFKICEEATDSASYLCRNTYGDAPRVEICSKESHTLEAYPASHIYHIFFELLKNSMRAVVELYGEDADDFPPINVTTSIGDEDVTIRISDQGGGFPLNMTPTLFNYNFTTAAQPALENLNLATTNAPLAGFGYGLPLARLYARYFGGDLQILPMEGMGTDAYVHLKAKSSDAFEVLPAYNRSSVANYDRDFEAALDWMNNPDSSSVNTYLGA